MKVRPILNKRNIASQCDFTSKKLRRLPHLFARVLELPVHSDTNVSVEETSDSFRFTASTNGGHTYITSDVRAQAIKIFPGVTKIVIRGMAREDHSFLEELELNLWRFRLPASTRPEMASARCSGGKLVVTVPKGVNSENDTAEDEEPKEEVEGWGGGYGKRVLVP